MIVCGIKLTDFSEISSRKFFLFTLETKLTKIEIETHRNPCHATDLLYTHLTKKEKAMGKKGISHRKFSIEFKLSVLSDYFQSNQSEGSICKKYQLSKGTILRWEKEYVLAEKALPLSSELLKKLEQMRTLKETSKVSRSREEELEDEIMRLRKALEYSELRNEALHEVLKIGREQFGIDLLKKVGAKQ